MVLISIGNPTKFFFTNHPLLFIKLQASEFLMFGCLMLIDMALFAYLAYRYKYVNPTETIQSDESTQNDSNDNIPMEEKPSKSD